MQRTNDSSKLTIEFETDKDGDRMPVHHYGDVTIRCYETWVWRDVELLADSIHNPCGSAVMTLAHAVVSLDNTAAFDFGLGADSLDDYAKLLPGMLFGLEVDENGTLFAKVWTGRMDAWHMDYDLRFSGPASSLRDKIDDVLRDVPIDYRTGWNFSPEVRTVGPVGHVSEMTRKGGDDAPDADVWGDFISGLDL